MVIKFVGDDIFFLLFNKGISEGGVGNDILEDVGCYVIDYFWNEVLIFDNLFNIIGWFIYF